MIDYDETIDFGREELKFVSFIKYLRFCQINNL